MPHYQISWLGKTVSIIHNIVICMFLVKTLFKPWLFLNDSFVNIIFLFILYSHCKFSQCDIWWHIITLLRCHEQWQCDKANLFITFVIVSQISIFLKSLKKKRGKKECVSFLMYNCQNILVTQRAIDALQGSFSTYQNCVNVLTRSLNLWSLFGPNETDAFHLAYRSSLAW